MDTQHTVQQAVLGHYELEVGSLLQLPAMIFFESDSLIEREH